MAIQVYPDVVHPAASSWTKWEPDAPYVTAGMTRVFHVTGLDDGSVNMPARVLARALSAVGIPNAGVLAPDGGIAQYGAVALDYRSIPIEASDNSVYLVVEYRSPTPRASGGGPPILIIEDDTELMQETTQLHPDGMRPMYVQWTDPLDKNNTIKKPATFLYTRTIRKLVVSGYVAGKDLRDARAAVNSVNKRPWGELPTGYWKFSGFRTEGSLLGDVFKVSAELTTKQDVPWVQVEILESSITGEAISIDQNEFNKYWNQGYQYDFIQGNGFTLAGLHKPIDFEQLFAIDIENG